MLRRQQRPLIGLHHNDSRKKFGRSTGLRTFTLAELQAALDASNVASAPSPDGITHAELRNLPVEYTLAILDWFKQIWQSGRSPENWKESLMIPIAKAGKPFKIIRNLRPIYLTSNLCKVIGRMALARLQCILEESDTVHHCKPDFAPA